MLAENLSGRTADFGWSGLFFLAFAGKNHVNLKETAGEVNILLFEFSKEAVENLAGIFNILFDSIVAIVNELWLDDRNDICRRESRSFSE